MPIFFIPKNKNGKATPPDLDPLAAALLDQTAPVRTPAAAPASAPGEAPAGEPPVLPAAAAPTQAAVDPATRPAEVDMAQSETPGAAKPTLAVPISPEDEAAYSCEGKEALRILRDVARETGQAQILFDHGHQVLISALLDVLPDSGELILDYGGVESLNRELLKHDNCVIISRKDRCKVQFTVDRIVRTQYEGRDAFSAPIPDKVVWLQRREFFRVRIPMGRPVKCRFSVGGERFEAEVADISLDGVGLVVHDMRLGIERGMTLEKAVLDLAASAPVATDLEVRSVMERAGVHDKPYRRVGCRFLSLPADALRELQRYLNVLERERRLKERGDF